jgi:Ankyrin repeats (3 copies)
VASPRTPAVDQFRKALRSGDLTQVRTLLESDSEVRAAVNAPIGSFGSRPVGMVRDNLPMVDLLLSYGADLNLKSDWWAGGFGLLEYGCTPEQAAPLIARGAVVDIFAAANLGMLDRVRELVSGNPALVHARGGDGKTALHCASTIAIATWLLDRGADIDARCVDHQSTAAQYLVRDHPDITRLLIDRGARFDIFIAVGLRDVALVERCLRDDPDALNHRIWHGKYRVVNVGERPATREEIGDSRGDIYRWVFDHNVGPLDVAHRLGYDDMVAVLERHATPAQRLLAACWRAERSTAEAIVAQDPKLVATLQPEQKTLIADAAHANRTAAVLLMLDVGFDPLVRGVDQWEPVRWAAFHGNVELLRRLLAHNPPIGVQDPTYGGTPIGQCLYGSLHGWHCRTGDFAIAVQLLIDAGEKPDRGWFPTGRHDVDAVLRRYFS